MEQIKTELPASSDYFLDVLPKIFKTSIKNLQCFPLRGDASDRNYFRLRFDTLENSISSVVLMQLMNPPIPKNTAFVTTQAFLAECGINTPGLYFKDYDKGFIFLEDLGDMTLEEKLNSSTSVEKEMYYKKALDILLNMQVECTKRISKDIPAYHLSFDLEKLTWELDFMTTYFIGGFLKQTISEKDKQILRKEFFKISSFLAKQKRYFCHRDFHSRNIMIHKENLILIDFQDARMGPCQYDLASLLRDSYFKLNPSFIEKLLNEYINKKERIEESLVNREEFLKVFDWMCIQRNLKALGTFGYQVSEKENERYRDAIPRTIKYVFTNLGKYNDLQRLKKCLEMLYN